MSSLKIQSASLTIADKLLYADLSFQIERKEFWGLLGKNGAGKTSLIHCIAGLRSIDSGDVQLNEISVQDYSRAELAREIGILFQDGLETLPATVMETVMLGRHPHVQSMFKDSKDDLEIARHALQQFALTELSERQIDSLSGGEKQRVAIAMLIAQQPNFFLLDEPSNHLDIAFQFSILQQLKAILSARNGSMLMATHDINLAARFCDKIVLLLENGDYLCGDKMEILTPENLSLAYGCEIRQLGEEGLAFFYPV
ncbi:MAG: ABC transporter ATP-binding protein [Gammaproteobacteria bacterium]|nr:ABC transporter ATP-binding protein [Gammaproteobacteria bacterium]MDD9895717.1 ABC transporter ATP-binding protein [Gammaproteobacteria bacterium]MDD9959694.1 ABC transporter ATP-binding protein [Gammaproteobacteria bacterium]